MISTDTVDQDIRSIADDAFEMMLGSRLEDSIAAAACPGERGDHLTSVIQVTGRWEGAMTIITGRETSRVIAERMFQTDELEDVEVLDAVGELVNVIGGQFKSLLEPPVQLSLPTVTEGVDHHTIIPGGRVLSCQVFVWEGHPVEISVVRRQPGR